MAAPIVEFQNAYLLTAAPGGGYTVASSAPVPPPFFIQDTPDNPVDNLALLGDISNDVFTVTADSMVIPVQYVGETADGNNIVATSEGATVLFTNNSFIMGQIVITSATPYVVCFVAGTSLCSSRNDVDVDVAVENLAVGDFVVTASGARRPIRWLGHRTIDCLAHLRPHEVFPVRISAHAFGENRPARDLFLSPGHPVLVDADDDGQGGYLVPIMCLINGTTIERVEVDEVTYWHVELDEHDILLAEGVPAESYLDWGDRAFFTEGSDHALHNPDFIVPGLGARCRPVAIDGSIVEAERRRLDMVFARRLVADSVWPSSDAAFVF